MKTSEIYQEICSILEEMGYLIFEDENDFVISEYITDSIQFISFIVEIEKRFSVNLSDDFLVYGILDSAQGFSNKLSFYINEN